jgi:hypothetical protein
MLNVESLFFIIELRHFQILDFFAEIIDGLLESFGVTNLPGLFDIENFFDWFEKLRFYFDFELYHFHLPTFFLFN